MTVIASIFHRLLANKDKRNLAIILLVFTISSIVLYGYYFFFSPFKLQLIYQNWDGPSYVVIAKSFYDREIIPQVNTLRLPTEYFAAHFPLYPLFIRLFSFIGYFQSMIFVSQLSTAIFLCAFYFLAKMYTSRDTALWLTVCSIFLTPRWFIVNHVGSSEPLFLLLLCLVILSLKGKRFFLSAVFASLLQLTRIQGILIFGGIFVYYLYLVIKKRKLFAEARREFAPFLLVPLTLLGVFILYHFRFGNFFAFFHAQTISNVSSHLQLPPFKVLSVHFTPTFAVESWKELYLAYYLCITYCLALLFKQRHVLLACIGLAYALPLFFIVHVDLARYSLPLLPLFLIALKEQVGSRFFIPSLLIVLPALYAFAINYMNFNLSP